MRNLKLLVAQFLSELRPLYSGTKENNVLREIVRDYRKGNGEPKEKDAFRNIELRRKNLLQSKVTIHKTDYGAGSIMVESGKTENISAICRTSSKKQSNCLFLYQLIKNLKPVHAIELGACLGVSGAYQAMALQQNRIGKLLTIEGSPGRAAIAEATFKEILLTEFVTLSRGKFEDVLSEELPKRGFVDYIFIDGHHQEDATVEYFQSVLPYFKNGGIMVFDDIYWSAGMNRAWDTIKNSRAFDATVVYKGMGVGFIKGQNLH
jgi:predicted O-methyltransferase YrrM